MSQINTPIKLTTDTLKKYKTTQLKAIQEIIWNSIDGDATEIKLYFEYNDLGMINKITIIDNGHGFSSDDIQYDISNLSLSNKSNKTHSPQKRLYHGKRGEGFYKIAQSGDVTWYSSNGKYELNCILDITKKEIISNSIESSSEHYTKVIIDNFDCKGVHQTTIQDDIVLNSLVSLKQYNISLYFNDIQYIYDTLLKKYDRYDTFHKFNNKQHKLTIEIIEINKDLPNSSKIIILANDNTVIKEIASQTKSSDNLPISIYIKFQTLDNNTVITEMDIESDIIKFARQEINKFKTQTIDDKKIEFFKKLEEKKILPSQLSKGESLLNPIEQEEKKVVEEILFKLYEYTKIDIDKKEKIQNARTLSFLLYKSLADGNEVLLDILQEVIKLNKQQLVELQEVLQHTTLSNIIKLSQEVIHRIKLLHYLELLFAKESDDNLKVKERSQLQKLIDKNMWLLSEDFLYFLSDKSIGTWVKIANEKLTMDNKITDLNQELTKDIPDYIIGKKKKGIGNYYHHLVVEIKRPNYIAKRDNIGKETQDYIESLIDISSKSIDTVWEMWFLVTDIHEDVKQWANEKQRIYLDTTHKNIPYKVYIKTWGDIIQQKTAELDYLSKELDIQVTTEDCKEYVLNKYPFMQISRTKSSS
ncbi:MAG: ATP-binding protein [Brevinema sp.]